MSTFRSRCFVLAALIISLAACGENNVLQPSSAPPPAPPAPPPPPTAGVTLSGRVLEFTESGERRPVANLRLKVRKGSTYDGAVGGSELDDAVTDANGRYTITDVTALVLFFQTAPESRYRFLCDSYPVVVSTALRAGGFPLSDLPVVDTAWSGARLPPGMWIAGTSVYGTVSERVNGSLRPVAGANVTLDVGVQDPPATTNASGFYMICSVVGTDQYRDLVVQKTEFHPITRQIFGGWDYEVNLELTRR